MKPLSESKKTLPCLRRDQRVEKATSQCFEVGVFTISSASSTCSQVTCGEDSPLTASALRGLGEALKRRSEIHWLSDLTLPTIPRQNLSLQVFVSFVFYFFYFFFFFFFFFVLFVASFTGIATYLQQIHAFRLFIHVVSLYLNYS